LAGAAGNYEGSALGAAEKLLACQETGAAELPFSGFFYRDESHRVIVHYSHQSREQQFMQAVEGLCKAWPEHARRPAWEAAMRRYGDYLKALTLYAAPYGMLPAGVHRIDEADDSETFPLLHLMTTHTEEAENYRAQLAAGTPIGENHVVRCFPVWFSFRGNISVQLAMGKGASLLGRYFGDEALRQIGREQLYWIWGKNPFCQSLQYGVGARYASQYAVLCGEAAGALPVGIQTRGNEDIPCWPVTNNATYKEVWTSSVSRFLWLAADYLSDEALLAEQPLNGKAAGE
jgi:hypothetical protein